MNNLRSRLDQLARDATQGSQLTNPATANRVQTLAPRRKSVLLVGLASLALVVGAVFLWQGTNRETTALVTAQESDTPVAQDPTSIRPTPTAIPPAPSTFFLPPSDEWAVVEYYGPDRDAPARTSHSGTWVWRYEGRLVLALGGSNVATSDAASPELATVDTDGNRLSMRVLIDDRRLSLVTFDADEAFIRDVGSRLEFDGENWALPGATPIVSEPSGSAPVASQEQIELAPVDADGVPKLAATVTQQIRVAAPGSLYRELHEASSLGVTTETTIAGFPAILVAGSEQAEPAWAAVAVDGRVYTWTTTTLPNTSGADIANLVASIETVTQEAWQAAIDNRDAEVAKAIAAQEVGLTQLAEPGDLPRFVLPEGWSIQWITDKGIWTDEQRASEIALSEARRPPELEASWPIASRTQGFGYSQDGNQTSIVPSITVSTGVFDDGRVMPQQPQNYTPISAAGGLTGSAFGRSAELYAENLSVWIWTTGLSEQQILDFVAVLRPRDGDPALGFDIDDHRYWQMFDATDTAERELSVRNQPSLWAGLWANDNNSSEASLSVRTISFQDLQMRLMDMTGSKNASGGPGDPLITSAFAGTSYWQYDTRAELLIELTLQQSTDNATDFFDTLIPIDIESWTELVTPFNADPLKPR